MAAALRAILPEASRSQVARRDRVWLAALEGKTEKRGKTGQPELCDSAINKIAQFRLTCFLIEQARFAGQFVRETGIRAEITNDSDKLRKVFSFVDAP